MSRCRAGALILIALISSSCASKLRVWNSTDEIAGVPFNAPVVYIKEFNKNRHSEFGTNCTLTPVVQTVTLPLGERFYANVDPAQFAKTGFAMSFSDNGALSQITLNTEPAGAENLKAVTEAITSVAPLFGMGARSGTDTARPPAGSLPACDMGETNVVFREFKK